MIRRGPPMGARQEPPPSVWVGYKRGLGNIHSLTHLTRDYVDYIATTTTKTRNCD